MPFASGIDLDGVQAGQTILDPTDQRDVDALVPPSRFHMIAERVGAQRSGVGHLDILIAAQPGQIDGGV